MKKIFLILLYLLTLEGIAVKESIINYILDDTKTTVTLLNRTEYIELNDDPWQISTGINSSVSFPNLKKYFNINPIIEFNFLTNHINSNQSTSRLVQSYVDIYWQHLIFSLGEKKLNFQEGQFISESSFNLIGRSFSQFGVNDINNTMGFYSLFSVTNPNTTSINYFYSGSYIVYWHALKARNRLNVSFYSFLLESHSNTYFVSPRFFINPTNSIAINIAYQDSPSISQNGIKKEAYYYDATYLHKSNAVNLKFGTRFFRGNSNDKYQFSAPYSSGHSWDGYLSTYQSNVQNGFEENFQSIYSSFSVPINLNRRITLSGYLFRSPDLTKNFGAEINLAIEETILKNRIFWTYKLGQFFSGNTNQESSLGMWLDFKFLLGDVI